MERRAIHDELFLLRPEQDELGLVVADEAGDVTDAWSELNSKTDTALAVGDSKTFVSLLEGMARQRGMSRVAQETGLARGALYRALSSDGNPELAIIVKVTMALGLRLGATRQAEE